MWGNFSGKSFYWWECKIVFNLVGNRYYLNISNMIKVVVVGIKRFWYNDFVIGV